MIIIFFNSYDRISIYNVRYMIIVFTIKPRYQMDFCVGGIWTQAPYLTTRHLPVELTETHKLDTC